MLPAKDMGYFCKLLVNYLSEERNLGGSIPPLRPIPLSGTFKFTFWLADRQISKYYSTMVKRNDYRKQSGAIQNVNFQNCLESW